MITGLATFASATAVSFSRIGIAAATTGIATAGIATAGIATAGIATAGAASLSYIHYKNLKADLETREEAQVRREKDLRELEVSRANLEAVLAQLSADSKSIVGSNKVS